MQLLLGFVFAIIIAALAHRAHALNTSGAFVAVFMGAIIFGAGGWEWAILLLTFFVTSSALSRAFQKRKQGLDEKFSKGHERDAGQVFGNGGIAAAFAALSWFFPDEPWTWVGFAAALAAVNADTWATELGVLSPRPPRLITNLRKTVEKGASGGVSVLGALAALAGSGIIGFLAVIFFPLATPHFPLPIYFLLITISGFAGSLFDSLLGATVQAMYFCPAEKKETEKHPVHTCGTPTVHIRGWKWLNNDWVNFSCGALGAATAAIFCVLL
ncbi:MAG: DUF92 domain-containing protein [Chloroflexi bacterium]|nr:DUF92 domain-containing protein [Chloroflexota bacterium]